MTTKISGDNISAIANTGVTWNAVTVADGSTTLNASSGNGYFLDTNAGVIEVFLPTSPTRGDTIILMDYAGTFATNQVIVNTGTTNLDSTTTRQYSLTTNDSIAEFIYVDADKGWVTRINTTTGTTPSGAFNETGTYDGIEPTYTIATGGTVTTSGDYKIHTFTGDGCFAVSAAGNSPLFPCTPTAGPAVVDYLVVAGGGGGGRDDGGGGGGGGYRESSGAASGCYSVSPLGACVSGITISATSYPVTVGAGGAGGSCQSSPCTANNSGDRGSNSIFSTITSTGGGGGQRGPEGAPKAPGGSGGGGCYQHTCGTGNTPPVSPPQGNPGGPGNPSFANTGTGGGGATQAGSGTPSPHNGGPGGAGATSSITGSPVTRSGGGGGGAFSVGGSGGSGGGGEGADQSAPVGQGQPGTENTGGGAGAGATHPTSCRGGGNGGKGIVIIRYKYQ